jgi:hypothetical protein
MMCFSEHNERADMSRYFENDGDDGHGFYTQRLLGTLHNSQILKKCSLLGSTARVTVTNLYALNAQAEEGTYCRPTQCTVRSRMTAVKKELNRDNGSTSNK